MAAIGRVHRLIALRGGELISFSSLADLNAGGDPRRRTGAQRISIETNRSPDTAGAFAPVTEGYRNRVVGMSSLNPDRAGDFLAVQFEFDNIFDFDLQPLRHRGTDLHAAVPSKL